MLSSLIYQINNYAIKNFYKYNMGISFKIIMGRLRKFAIAIGVILLALFLYILLLYSIENSPRDWDIDLTQEGYNIIADFFYKLIFTGFKN